MNIESKTKAKLLRKTHVAVAALAPKKLSKKAQLAALLSEAPQTLMMIASLFQISRSAAASLIGDCRRDKLPVVGVMRDTSMWYQIGDPAPAKKEKPKFGKRAKSPEAKPEPVDETVRESAHV